VPDAEARDHPTIRWLLEPEDPSVRYLTLIDLLGESARSPEARRAAAAIPRAPLVRALLDGQKPDAGFGVHPYAKWVGAHWRLVSLVELGIPARDRLARAAYEDVLRWLHGGEHAASLREVAGRWRCHASQEGNALAVGARLGLARDARVVALAERLLAWQWPDGGWNCDSRPPATHSSFHESLATLWGVAEYARATGSRRARSAASRAAEFLLRHRLFRSESSGAVIHRDFVRPHWPPYWHYDLFRALAVLARLDPRLVRDPRAAEAVEIVAAARDRDGRWRAGARYWRIPSERAGRPPEAVDWGTRGPSKHVTLNALRVLRSARPRAWLPA
jgi:hypothetical protein